MPMSRNLGVTSRQAMTGAHQPADSHYAQTTQRDLLFPLPSGSLDDSGRSPFEGFDIPDSSSDKISFGYVILLALGLWGLFAVCVFSFFMVEF